MYIFRDHIRIAATSSASDNKMESNNRSVSTSAAPVPPRSVSKTSNTGVKGIVAGWLLIIIKNSDREYVCDIDLILTSALLCNQIVVSIENHYRKYRVSFCNGADNTLNNNIKKGRL